jgi:hypothetical protein
VTDRMTPLPTPAPSAIFKPMSEGGVLFSTESEVYFGVNLVGARIWELLPVAESFENLCRVLAEQYTDVTEELIRQDVQKFLNDLLVNGLVIGPKSDGSSSATLPKRPPEAP